MSAPQLDIRSYQVIRTRMFETFTNLRRDCRPETITSEALQDFMAELRKLITTMETTSLFSAQQLRAERHQARMALQTLLRHAPWLDRAIQEEISEFIEAQPEFLDDRFHFTVDYSPNYEQVWPAVLGPFAGKPNLNFLEVGSLEGRSACWLLTHILTNSTSRLVCIDMFDEEGLNQGLIDITPALKDSFGMSLYERFKYNVNIADKSGRVSILKGQSAIWLRTLKPATFDFAYIDASHVAKDVLQDGVLAWGVLKCGGILAFDDYYWSSPFNTDPLASPKLAIDAFLDIFKNNYTLLHRGEQIIVRKDSE